MTSEHLKVGIRIRPLLGHEAAFESVVSIENVNHIQETTVNVVDGEHFLSSKFDKVFPSISNQENIFEFISPSIQQSLKGFNTTIFAYGQTGSGKTYSMFGSNWENNNPAPQNYYISTNKLTKITENHPLDNLEGHGLIPRSISQVFESTSTENLTIYTSFLQIYNEKIFDLLQETSNPRPLAIRENKMYGIFVEGLAEYIVENKNDCFLLLAKGDSNRVVRQTKLNQHSSRSHTIFQMLIETDKANKKGALKKSKLNFCDLAGSEKYDKENKMTNEHIKEMTQINKSLTSLGKVIHELGRKKSIHIPYRDSKLTRLLQDSLGLSTRTILIATISSSSSCIEETINTLKFADRAKQVMVKAKKNEVSALNNEVILKLQREIQHLKGLLNLKKKGGIQELQSQLLALKEENKKLKMMTVEEVERLKMENKKLRIELQNMGQVKEAGDPYYKDDAISLNSSSSMMRLPELSPRIELENESCPICLTPVPCVHYTQTSDMSRMAISPALSLGDMKERNTLKPIMSSIDFHKKLGVRYRMKDKILESNELIEEIKERENSQKQIRLARNRLDRITQLEKIKKQQFKEELEKIIEMKKRADEEKKRKMIKKSQTESLQDLYQKKKEKLLNSLNTKLD
ncbi:hypothetical protein SteCoe_4488 [Stentor coeruleus]|uniref:Kinesin-like protein n=1 Tax=Stentor coeruleus TaxID=5963 RepID=A0A1R2CUS2_9CILI|nr:hypothetical protein SteCoe_4488 [Stentor coeruleus]